MMSLMEPIKRLCIVAGILQVIIGLFSFANYFLADIIYFYAYLVFLGTQATVFILVFRIGAKTFRLGLIIGGIAWIGPRLAVILLGGFMSGSFLTFDILFVGIPTAGAFLFAVDAFKGGKRGAGCLPMIAIGCFVGSFFITLESENMWALFLGSLLEYSSFLLIGIFFIILDPARNKSLDRMHLVAENAISNDKSVEIKPPTSTALNLRHAQIVILCCMLILASLLSMSGNFAETFLHEGGHAVVFLQFVPPGFSITINILKGYTFCNDCGIHFSLNVAQYLAVEAAGPIASLILLNIIVFLVQRWPSNKNVLIRLFFWGIAGHAVQDSTGYLLVTLFAQGDTMDISQVLAFLLNTPWNLIGLVFTIAGAILTLLYLVFIYRGVKEDLTKYFADLPGMSSNKYKIVLTLFSMVVFTVFSRFTSLFWDIRNSFYSAIILIEFILILSGFIIMLVVNKIYISRLGGRYSTNNSRVLVITIAMIIIFTIIPSLTFIS